MASRRLTLYAGAKNEPIPLTGTQEGKDLTMTKTIATVLGALAVVLAPFAAPAEQYPAGKPIEMTVMFGAGSAADVTARHLAEGMAKYLAAPVPIVNRTGGGGALGYTFVSQQKPDGYSIIWNSNSISTTYHSGILPFDYKAFDPVARVSIEIPALAVRGDAPWKTLKEFVDYAKANPDKVRIGNSGIGSHTHLTAAALMTLSGAKVVQVPFGQGQAVVNLLGSRIEATVQLPAALVGHVKSGDLRVLAVLGSKRDPVFPDVPTAQELGFKEGLDLWRGIAVPKGTPKPVIARLQDAIKKTVESPEFKEAGQKVGFTPAYLPAEEFGKMIASDDKMIAQVMTEAGLKKK
jgi:tripartite-type tricarboxylate transporter receptor subunit TctC